MPTIGWTECVPFAGHPREIGHSSPARRPRRLMVTSCSIELGAVTAAFSITARGGSLGTCDVKDGVIHRAAG